MSNELTSIGNAGDGWEAASQDNSDRVLHGHLLKFADWRWTYGQEGTVLNIGTCLQALGTISAWVKWEDGKPAKHILMNGTAKIQREELGDDNELEWEAGPDGKPRDPWQYTKYVYLFEPKSAEAFTWSTSSSSGRQVVFDLASQIQRKRFGGRHVIPIVELGAAEMKTKYGRKSKPVLKVVSWLEPNHEPEVKSTPRQLINRDLDDAIPF